MHCARHVLWSLEFPLDESFVNHDLGGDVGEFASLPGFHLLAHRFEVALHSVYADRNAIDQRERFRVFGENGSERTSDDVSKFGSVSRSRHAVILITEGCGLAGDANARWDVVNYAGE